MNDRYDNATEEEIKEEKHPWDQKNSLFQNYEPPTAAEQHSEEADKEGYEEDEKPINDSIQDAEFRRVTIDRIPQKKVYDFRNHTNNYDLLKMREVREEQK